MHGCKRTISIEEMSHAIESPVHTQMVEIRNMSACRADDAVKVLLRPSHSHAKVLMASSP